MSEVLAVAKKKKPENPVDRKQIALSIKGSQEWKDWLERAAAHANMSVSAFVDRASRVYAKKEGFDEPGPQR